MKLSSFKVNYGRELRIGFDIRKKGKNVNAEEFVKKMKNRHEKAKATLVKSQEEMKRQVDRNRKEAEEYKVGDKSVDKYKELSNGADEESDKKVDKEVYWTLCGQKNYIRKCGRVEIIGIVKNTPSSECEKSSEVSRAGRGTEEDTTISY